MGGEFLIMFTIEITFMIFFFLTVISSLFIWDKLIKPVIVKYKLKKMIREIDREFDKL